MDLDIHANQQGPDTAHLRFNDVRAPKLPVPNLSAPITETKNNIEAHLPPLAISTGNVAIDFARGLGQSLVHSAVQSPLEGAAQTFDHTVGAVFDTHLYEKTKDLIVAAPKPAAFGTAEWHGQSIGAALGMVPWFLASKNAVRAGAGLLSVTSGLVVSEAEAAAGSKLLSGTGVRLVLEGGVTGAVYAGAFKPVDASAGNYWSAKGATMVGDFSSFATLSGTSLALAPVLKSAALPLMEKYPDASKLIGRATSILGGGLSGIPAAGLETVSEHLQPGRDAPLSLDALGKNIYSFGIVGGTLGAGHSGAAENPRSNNSEVGKYNTLTASKPVEAKPIEAKPADLKSVDVQPAEAKPIEGKPANSKSVDVQPAEAKPIEAKPADSKSVDVQPAEVKPFEPMPAYAMPVEAMSAEAMPAESVGAGETSKLEPMSAVDPSGHVFLGGYALSDGAKAELKRAIEDYEKGLYSDTGTGKKFIFQVTEGVDLKKHPIVSWDETSKPFESYEIGHQIDWTLDKHSPKLSDEHGLHLSVDLDTMPATTLGYHYYTFSAVHHSDILSTEDVSAALDSIPSARRLNRILDGDSGVGELPEPFAKTGLNQKEAFAKLDALAKGLRELDTVLPPQKKFGLGAQDLDLPSFTVGLGDSTMQVSKIGIGEVAHVYKLSLDGHDYAFKVPNDPGRMDVHGSYAETAAFAYLSRAAISDLVDFYAARPGTSGGWMLTEFVDKPVQRAGRPLAEVLAEHNLKLGDDWSANRGPGNVVWDLGGIEPINVPRPKSILELSELLDTLKGQVIAGRKLDAIKDQSELKAALLLCLEHPSVGGQVARSAALNLEAPADLADVLSKALEINGAAGRAAFELDRLANTPYVTALFHKALLHTESRVEASKQIDKLPPEDRKAAFDAAMIYPEARAMAARSIPSIPDAQDRAAAAATAAQFPGSNFVLYHNLAKDQALTTDQLAAMQTAFDQHFENHGLKTGGLAKDVQSLEFDKWWHKQLPERGSISEPDLVESQIRGIWDHLKESHKALGIDDLAAVSRNFNILEPSDWQSMTAKEALDFANLVDELGLYYGNAQTIFQYPDLKKFLNDNLETIKESSGKYNLLSTIDGWEELPGDYRKLDAASLLQITKIGNLGHWTKVPAAEAIDWARTISSLGLGYEETDSLLETPEFAKWYSQYLDQGQELKKHDALVVLNVWDRLTAEQKSLSSLDLAWEAYVLETRKQLESTFGPDSPAVEYFLSRDALANALAKPAMKWVTSMERQSPDYGRLAKEVIGQLIKDGAPATSFERIALQNKFDLKLTYPNDEQFQKILVQKISDPDCLSSTLSLIKLDIPRNRTLVRHAIEKYGFDGDTRILRKIKDTWMIASRLDIDPDGAAYLLDQRLNGVRFNNLERYLDSGDDARERVRALVSRRAARHLINARHLADQDVLRSLTNFNESELNKLAVLQEAGLPAMQLKEHLIDAPEDYSVFSRMLANGADVKEFQNYLRMSVLPSDVNQNLVEAIKHGQLALRDVVQGLKDWKSGREFYNLLIEHVKSGAPSSTATINDLRARAQSAASPHPGLAGRRTIENEESQAVADTFLEALKGIKETIPPERPIILLGRDAWPLVPLLRASGRDARYFLWSRLQNDNLATKQQWLKEVPPGAAVIDTGFSGSIINNIRKIDPEVSGYLMSTSDGNKYRRLLASADHSAQVNRVEAFPKLIYRSSNHTNQGNAVSRPKALSDDEDIPRSLELSSHWHTERRAREVLRAAGLPAWDVWRYGQFTGLTPTERLGLHNRSELESHYQSVRRARSL